MDDFHNEYRKTWKPEDYGFEPIDTFHNVFRFKNFELRRRSDNYWLLRRFVKQKDNTEKLVKWFVKINQYDVEFAEIMFTKGII